MIPARFRPDQVLAPLGHKTKRQSWNDWLSLEPVRPVALAPRVPVENRHLARFHKSLKWLHKFSNVKQSWMVIPGTCLAWPVSCLLLDFQKVRVAVGRVGLCGLGVASLFWEPSGWSKAVFILLSVLIESGLLFKPFFERQSWPLGTSALRSW